jgi:hypothetical protein
MVRTLVFAAQPASSGRASRLTSRRTVHAVVPTLWIRAGLSAPRTTTDGLGQLGSGRVAAIGVAIEVPLQAAARHDNPPAEAQ